LFNELTADTEFINQIKKGMEMSNLDPSIRSFPVYRSNEALVPYRISGARLNIFSVMKIQAVFFCVVILRSDMLGYKHFGVKVEAPGSSKTGRRNSEVCNLNLHRRKNFSQIILHAQSE
jgi:hypothetical protein